MSDRRCFWFDLEILELNWKKKYKKNFMNSIIYIKLLKCLYMSKNFLYSYIEMKLDNTSNNNNSSIANNKESSSSSSSSKLNNNNITTTNTSTLTNMNRDKSIDIKETKEKLKQEKLQKEREKKRKKD